MELRFISPVLSELDRAGMEVLLSALFMDERPPRGVAGLFDWRSAGCLSRLISDGFVSGDLGEILMIPAKPGLPFDKVLVFGAGQSAQFDDQIFSALVERMLETLARLRVRSAVAQLPGRHLDVIAPERAVEILLELGADNAEHDVWTLVEPPAAQKAITEHLLKKRRRKG